VPEALDPESLRPAWPRRLPNRLWNGTGGVAGVGDEVSVALGLEVFVLERECEAGGALEADES
jgi:hypothetical protein